MENEKRNDTPAAGQPVGDGGSQDEVVLDHPVPHSFWPEDPFFRPLRLNVPYVQPPNGALRRALERVPAGTRHMTVDLPDGRSVYLSFVERKEADHG